MRRRTKQARSFGIGLVVAMAPIVAVLATTRTRTASTSITTTSDSDKRAHNAPLFVNQQQDDDFHSQQQQEEQRRRLSAGDYDGGGDAVLAKWQALIEQWDKEEELKQSSPGAFLTKTAANGKNEFQLEALQGMMETSQEAAAANKKVPGGWEDEDLSGTDLAALFEEGDHSPPKPQSNPEKKEEEPRRQQQDDSLSDLERIQASLNNGGGGNAKNNNDNDNDNKINNNNDNKIKNTATKNINLVFVTGMVRNFLEIREDSFQALMELNCEHHVGIHVLVGSEVERGVKRRNDFIRKKNGVKDKNCAPFFLLLEPPEARSAFENRVDRISFLRDFQRSHLQQVFNVPDLENHAVVVADLDLGTLPTASQLMTEVLRLIHTPHVGVVCAAGMMHNPYGYYDIFATVLADGTFAYPRRHRLLPDGVPNEERSLVASDDVYGDVMQSDLKLYFDKEGAAHPDMEGLVKVRSCFGGLAIYRASTFFLDSCAYVKKYNHLMAYANRDDGRPCEHVVFHDCLQEKDPSVIVAVQSNMHTFWDKTVRPWFKMRVSGRLRDGLTNHNGLVAIAGAQHGNITLANGDYTLRINDHGVLAVERRRRLDKEEEEEVVHTVWKADVYDFYHQEDHWKKAFLILRQDGLLVLYQQVSQRATRLGPGLCKPVGPTSRDCRVVVWTSGVRGDKEKEYELVLRRDGIILVLELPSGKVLWRNAPSPPPEPAPAPAGEVATKSEAGKASSFLSLSALADSMSSSATTTTTTTKSSSSSSSKKEVKSAPCIPSGDETAINSALTDVGSSAVLCQGAVFTLFSAIQFTQDSQKVYTVGYPKDDDKRATLRIGGTTLTTAVNMRHLSFVELRNVIVDGGWNVLGPRDGDALIYAGGSGAGQTIRHVKAYGTRSWTLLHAAEGGGTPCGGVTVEKNEFGPAGTARRPANAISMACPTSRIVENVVTDVTHVGIMIFGAKGSQIQDNVIETSRQRLLAAIAMTSFAPFDGDYTNTRVTGNTIVASKGASIRVGIAIGEHVFECRGNNPKGLLFGGVVKGNRLQGEGIHYGVVVDGVRDWILVNNVDEATRGAGPGDKPPPCRGHEASPPASIVINRPRAEGLFPEHDIREGSVEHVELGWK